MWGIFTRLRGLSPGLAACWSVACGPGQLPTTETAERRLQQPVINGTDDRREVYEVDSGPLKDMISGSVAALMWSHRVSYTGPGGVTLRGDALGEQLSLCEGERFAEQPSLAFCSAILIDDDLLLTAGHCFGTTRAEADDRCQRISVVFGYELTSDGELASPDASNVYTCRRVTAYEKEDLEQDFLDLAVFQLDRSVSDGRRPAPLAASPPQVGDTLTLAATGAGLPLKVDQDAEVTSVPQGAGFFVATTDSFAGGSGGALFSTSLALLGHQVRGAADWTFDGDCMRAAYAEQSEEQHQLVSRSLAALCESAWPTELCGIDAACGDGLCSGGETAASCGADCPAPRCGDGLCEVSERSSCVGDCAAFSAVPSSWTGDPKNYSVAPAPHAAARNAGPPAGCSMSATRTSSGGSCWWGLWFMAPRRRRGARTRAR